MRTKILFAVALVLGIASLVLLMLGAVDQTTISILLVIGLISITIEYLVGKKENKDSEE